MKGRFVVWCGGLAGATSVLALAIAPLAGQTLTPAKATVAKAAPARAAASPKTPWGELANTRAAEHVFAEGSGPDPATMHLELGGAGGDRDPFGGGE
jgi:hypothetical protein